ncbi:MAG: methyltransferase domain-containing protein [Planctomycetota bacterium]
MKTDSQQHTLSTKVTPAQTSRRLNLGCGRCFHSEWTNVDLEPVDFDVIACDITNGLPFQDQQFDAVYHSHVLEHLSPEAGKYLLSECFRVLRPGGILRIVVPDLEQIAKLYLQAHEDAWSDEDASKANYDWMKLELLDQMVREQSGGQMGQYMTREQLENESFVRSRLGDEFVLCQNHEPQPSTVKTFSARVGDSVSKFKKNMTRKLVRWIMGQEAQQAFDEGLFRRQGEIHRWMYDRYSLKQLCLDVGLVDFGVCDAFTSSIEDFTRFELDTVSQKTRKPDSLFAECRRPPVA